MISKSLKFDAAAWRQVTTNLTLQVQVLFTRRVLKALAPFIPIPPLSPTTTCTRLPTTIPFLYIHLYLMGCIPSKQAILQGFDEHPKTTQKCSFMKPAKCKSSCRWRKQRPPSPEIPADAPPWVAGHSIVTVHRDAKSGEVYLTEKQR